MCYAVLVSGCLSLLMTGCDTTDTGGSGKVVGRVVGPVMTGSPLARTTELLKKNHLDLCRV